MNPKPYKFHRIIGESEGTDVLYREYMAPVVEHLMRGFNGAVLAYGQTNSGKTTTIRGHGKAPGGLLSLTIRDLLNLMAADTEPGRWSLRMSYLEVYNEVILDLLTGRADLRLHDCKDGSLRVAELSEDVARNLQ